MKYRKLIFLAFIVIMFSFFLPKLFLKIEDLSIEKQVCTVAKPKSKIDVQAKNIYLVKAIHDIHTAYKNVKITQREKAFNIAVEPSDTYVAIEKKDERIWQELKDEILKLQNTKLLKQIDLDSNTKNLVYFSEKMYHAEENEYRIKNYYLEDGIEVEIENKTGKILYCNFPKEKRADNVELEEILENYIQYLDLGIVDDWKFENGLLQSEKAQLCASLKETEKMYVLTIYPLESYEKYYEIVEKAK